MRTTLRIDDRLLDEAKKVAAKEGKSLGEVVEDALRESLHRRQSVRPGAKAARVKLPTVGGRGLQPGVDLDDTASLLDLLEGRR